MFRRPGPVGLRESRREDLHKRRFEQVLAGRKTAVGRRGFQTTVRGALSYCCAGGIHMTRRLPDEEIEQLLGTTHPLRTDAEKLSGMISDQLGHGESVCRPVHDGDEPCGWWFAGYTV